MLNKAIKLKIYGISEYEKIWANFEDSITITDMQNALSTALIQYLEIDPNGKNGHQLYLQLLLMKAEKFLSNAQIYEMFIKENILHEAHWDDWDFEMLWNFLSNHTSVEERKRLLLQDDLGDRNLYFYSDYNDKKTTFSRYNYRYFFYDFTPFKVFHRAMTVPYVSTFNITKEIYHKHFNKTEMQEIILSSNEFIYYVIGRATEEPCKDFVSYLEKLFEGSEKDLKKFLERKIKPTYFSALAYVEDFKGLIYSIPYWFDNLKSFSDLYDRIKYL